MSSESEKPARILTRRFGITWRRTLSPGTNIRLDYQDIKVGKEGLIFHMATQVVHVMPFQNGEPVISYKNGNKEKIIVGHEMIKAEGIHGRTKQGRNLKIA